mgnify:CR=1 FL=1
MSHATTLRARAQREAGTLPALLAQATDLASTVLLGDHGRRRAGMGDSFWQYRAAQPTDGLRAIDWRRSARGDDTFVQDKEWQIAQSVLMWVDTSAAMQFRSADSLPAKADRARLLALATAILLNKGGERIGLTAPALAPSRGTAQIEKLAAALCTDTNTDYGTPDSTPPLAHARALYISDFLGDIAPIEAALTKAADRGVQGVLLQILDPQEETFPFHGRTVFQSMSGTKTHETLKADGLRSRYLHRLADRKDRLTTLARQTGWQFKTHHSDQSAISALLWLHQTIGGRA